VPQLSVRADSQLRGPPLVMSPAGEDRVRVVEQPPVGPVDGQADRAGLADRGLGSRVTVRGEQQRPHGAV